MVIFLTTLIGAGCLWFASEQFTLVENSDIPVMNHQGQVQDWETYRNEVYGIEFQYPKGWFFETNFDTRLSFEQNQDQSSLDSQITNYPLTSLPVEDNFYVTPKDFFSISFTVIDRRFATKKNNYTVAIKKIEERYRGDHYCLFSNDKLIGSKHVKELKAKASCEETNEIIWFDNNRIVLFNSTKFHNDSQRNVYYHIISSLQDL